jgi:hypothetical protein
MLNVECSMFSTAWSEAIYAEPQAQQLRQPDSSRPAEEFELWVWS